MVLTCGWLFCFEKSRQPGKKNEFPAVFGVFCLTKKRKIDLAKEIQGNTTTKAMAFVIFEHCYQETSSKRMGLSKSLR